MADEPDEGGWSPDKEFDPLKVQAEYVEVMKRLLKEAEDDRVRRAESKKKVEEELAQIGREAPVVAHAYRVPTFAELSARLQRAWEETKRIASDAPPHVQAFIVQNLVHAPPEEEEDDGTQIAEF